jgi:hypothetical protein
MEIYNQNKTGQGGMGTDQDRATDTSRGMQGADQQ